MHQLPVPICGSFILDSGLSFIGIYRVYDATSDSGLLVVHYALVRLLSTSKSSALTAGMLTPLCSKE